MENIIEDCSGELPIDRKIECSPIMLASYGHADVKHLAQMLAMEKRTQVIITEPKGWVNNLHTLADTCTSTGKVVKLFADVTKKILPEKRGTNLTPKKKKRK